MISVTDELLFELYMLDRNNIEYRKSKYDYYLFNRSLFKYKFEIGLVAKVPNELLATHSIDEIIDGCAKKHPNYFCSKLLFIPIAIRPKLFMHCRSI